MAPRDPLEDGRKRTEHVRRDPFPQPRKRKPLPPPKTFAEGLWRGVASMMQFELDLRMLPRKEKGPMRLMAALAIISALVPGVGVSLPFFLLAMWFIGVVESSFPSRDGLSFKRGELVLPLRYALSLATVVTNLMFKGAEFSLLDTIEPHDVGHLVFMSNTIVGVCFITARHRLVAERAMSVQREVEKNRTPGRDHS